MEQERRRLDVATRCRTTAFASDKTSRDFLSHTRFSVALRYPIFIIPMITDYRLLHYSLY